MSSLANFSTIEIPPGKVVAINAEGRNFHVVFAPVDIQIKWPGGEFVTYQQGSGVDNLPDGETFKRLEVRNPTLGTILVQIWIGGPLYRDSRANSIEPRTEFAASAVASIAGGASVDLDGIPTGLRIRRKAVQVTNLDPNLNFQLRDAAGNVGLTVFAQTSITLPISEFVRIHNPNGAPQAISISEIWWTL
jgi:hypothetical protein